MRKLKNEQDRKQSITISMSSETMRQLHQFRERLGLNRSETVRKAVDLLFHAWIVPELDREKIETADMDDFPDDVNEVGYNPFTGSYSEEDRDD